MRTTYNINKQAKKVILVLATISTMSFVSCTKEEPFYELKDTDKVETKYMEYRSNVKGNWVYYAYLNGFQRRVRISEADYDALPVKSLHCYGKM